MNYQSFVFTFFYDKQTIFFSIFVFFKAKQLTLLFKNKIFYICSTILVVSTFVILFCFKECTAASISNGAVVTGGIMAGDKVDHGTTVTYGCNIDYSTTDSLILTCNNGVLTPLPTCYASKIFLNFL